MKKLLLLSLFAASISYGCDKGDSKKAHAQLEKALVPVSTAHETFDEGDTKKAHAKKEATYREVVTGLMESTFFDQDSAQLIAEYTKLVTYFVGAPNGVLVPFEKIDAQYRQDDVMEIFGPLPADTLYVGALQHACHGLICKGVLAERWTYVPWTMIRNRQHQNFETATGYLVNVNADGRTYGIAGAQGRAEHIRKHGHPYIFKDDQN